MLLLNRLLRGVVLIAGLLQSGLLLGRHTRLPIGVCLRNSRSASGLLRRIAGRRLRILIAGLNGPLLRTVRLPLVIGQRRDL